MSADRDLADYSRDLRLSLAREELAEALYHAKATAYQLSLPPWKSLTYLTREDYRAMALRDLQTLKPQPKGLPPVVVTGLRPTHGPVIGTIGRL